MQSNTDYWYDGLFEVSRHKYEIFQVEEWSKINRIYNLAFDNPYELVQVTWKQNYALIGSISTTRFQSDN